MLGIVGNDLVTTEEEYEVAAEEPQYVGEWTADDVI